jgi:membrane fusion protein, copper/silver efflux system
MKNNIRLVSELCAARMRRPTRHTPAPAAGAKGTSGPLGGVCVALLLISCVVAPLAACSRHDSAASAAPAASAGQKYFCPMHPNYVSDRPGDCPICSMRLVPMQNGASPMQVSTSAVPGRVTIQVSPEKRQLIGLSTSPVERRKLTRVLRALGTVEHDERRLARVAPRFAGWVRSLQVAYTGQPVEKGDPLFTVYSPELFTAESEYLLAVRNQKSLTSAAGAQNQAAQELAASARRRLELLGIDEAEIGEIEKGGKARDELLIRAPFTGHVVSKTAVEGKAFMAGETLYEIADLHHLWVRASLFEYELPQVKIGEAATITFPNLENRRFESSVTFIYPHVDPETRRAEVRLELDNPGHVLRPDMWANVEISADVGEVLAVPASAVLDTGERQLAFVDGPNQRLEPREVKIGVRTENYWEVLGGLKAGEKVVTRALFLVDSESQLKSAVAGMEAH